jgi:hypothetical protein
VDYCYLRCVGDVSEKAMIGYVDGIVMSYCYVLYDRLLIAVYAMLCYANTIPCNANHEIQNAKYYAPYIKSSCKIQHLIA